MGKHWWEMLAGLRDVKIWMIKAYRKTEWPEDWGITAGLISAKHNAKYVAWTGIRKKLLLETRN